jgi:anaerobic ribonucleoside-triphosphate reductase activating protein
MTGLRVNRMHHPVTALGHGTRAGVWVQGCSIGCRGCASRDTWDAEAGDLLTPAEVVGWLDTLPEPLDGVTVSGGEPFQQPAALTELLNAIGRWRGDRDLDLLVFSGYGWSRLSATPGAAAALGACDAVVAGPYVEARNTGTPLRGSDNQQIVTLTELGALRYGDPAGLAPSRMQIAFDGDRIRIIGIPRRGDLDRLLAGLTARGIALDTVTWQG